MTELNPLGYAATAARDSGWEADWVPFYSEEPAPIEVSEAYQIYKRFGVLVGATNPVTGNDYLLEWKNNYGNQSSYSNIKKRVEGLQNGVDRWELFHIRNQSRMVIDLRRKYTELTQRLEDVMQARRSAEAEIENIQQFLDPEGLIRELSPYDDTSQIDDTQEMNVGREFPVRLTSKVAQQWYKRFAGALVRGCRDVRNYGPFIGGTPFYRPSLRKQLVFDGNNYGQPLRGIPMTIVDEEVLSNTARIFDLSESGDGWTAFGLPLPMDEWGKIVNEKQVNRYGYIGGQVSYDEEGNNRGGSHVANYGEFLEFFGLGPENKIEGHWPKPQDTPMFTLEAQGPRGGGGGFGASLAGALGAGAALNLVTSVGKGNWATGGLGRAFRRQLSREQKRKVENKPWNKLFREGDEGAPPLKHFTMIDEYGNIACPNILKFGNESYVQSGWSLQSAGQLVYLYPDWDNAIAYDPRKAAAGRDDAWMPHAHSYKPPNYTMDHQGGRSGNRNGPWGRDDNPDEWRVGNAHDDMNKKNQAEEALDEVKASRNMAFDRGAGRLRGGGYTYFVPGPRLDSGDHNPNLTIHEKRALVIDRSSTKHRFMPLGKENPTYDGTWAGGAYSSYQNPKWPYGTGWYHKRNSDWGKRIYGSRAAPITGPRDSKVAAKEMAAIAVLGGATTVAYVGLGTALGVLPENIWGSNYGMYIGDLLMRLPHRGQFTIVNDDDNSPTTIDFDGTIRNGKEIDTGFVNFVCQELIHLGVKNRRIGTRWDDGKLKTYTIASHSWKDRLSALFGNNPVTPYRIKDTTYGDLFGPDGRRRDDGGEAGAVLDFADFSQKIIKSVAEIPVRREIVDNLLNKTNENMSLSQFLQNIMHPSALGISTGNIYTTIRPAGGDGGFEVAQVSKNWAAIGKKVREEIKQAETNASGDTVYPTEVMFFDYKAADSLIKSIDMSSKFDPGVAGTFERAAANLSGGNKDDLMKFLSYGTMAVELRDFLAVSGPEDQPDLYKDVIRVDEGDAGSVHVNWSMMGFDASQSAEKIAVPDSVFSKFLMQNPDRMTKLMAVVQTGSGQTWATDLLANYMRGCTITIHGTCNIKPFNYIKVAGVLPNMMGLYMVHNVRDSVTPQDFNTIIEAVLIDPDPSDENKDAEKQTG